MGDFLSWGIFLGIFRMGDILSWGIFRCGIFRPTLDVSPFDVILSHQTGVAGTYLQRDERKSGTVMKDNMGRCLFCLFKNKFPMKFFVTNFSPCHFSPA